MSTADKGLLAFYLIDGHAQIFRAYYAIRQPLTSPVTGEPTSAVYAFGAMLLNLLQTCQPDYLAMAIDMPGKTFRHDLYPKYKAQRKPPPDDFAPQVERIFEMVRLFHIPLLGTTGVEADDVIATIADQVICDPEHQDVQVRIVSKDKDLEQLLSDRVTMVDIQKQTTIDANWLMDNRGITPDQVIDMLTLTGDTVDNVPGVVGVGPKTATQLIQQYSSVEGIFDNLDKIKGKRRLNLEAARDKLVLGRELITLKRDVQTDFYLAQCTIGPIDTAALGHFFNELGLGRLGDNLDRITKKLRGLTAVKAPDVSDGFAQSLFATDHADSSSHQTLDAGDIFTGTSSCIYSAVTTAAQLEQLVKDLRSASIIGVDTETIGLGSRVKLCGICLAFKENSGVYIPVRSPVPSKHLDEATVLGALGPVLEDPAIAKCGHNLKYDWLVLRHAGVTLRGIQFDSMIAAFMLNSPSLGLDNLARSLLNHQMIPISRLIGPREKAKAQKTMDQAPLEEIVPYAAEDADMALRLYHKMSPALKAMGMSDLCEKVEMPLVQVLGQMQFDGIKVDPAVLEEQKTVLSRKIIDLRDQIHELADEPFNIDSPRQLSHVLFTQMKMPVIKKTKTGASTDVEVLEKLRELEDVSKPPSALPRLIMEYRQFAKLVSTYLGNLVESIDRHTGRVHASFTQTGAATGRLSSHSPNLQNIPVRSEVGRQIRKAFISQRGHVLISGDYSQIELRILAHLSEDAVLLDAFSQDMDIHTAVAAQVFGVTVSQVTPPQRAQAKVINFGIIYGVTPYGLSRRIDGLDVEAAKKLIEDYRRQFEGIDRFMEQCVQHALKKGYVQTMMGRRRLIPQIQSTNANMQSLGKRLAINSVVQGSAADLIKMAMVNLHQRIENEQLQMKLLLQIHDELVVEVKEEDATLQAAIVQQVMESAMTLRVPLKVEVGLGKDWLDAK